LSAQLFEQTWRASTLGGFLFAREATRLLLDSGGGSLLFTGATASLRGKPPFAAFAAAKAGLRSLSQSFAREFGPQNVHVAHVVIDGAIDGERVQSRAPDYLARLGEDGALKLEDIADAYWYLHTQPRSAWTQELDLRPFKEPF
jgi:NAD(P)-dependent dehydrogenase (short-subunit alcohol dehydrogenase family)